LGEIALRVSDLNVMQAFYEEIVGLELMRRFPESAFFRLADGYGGHTQILALFDRTASPGYRGISAERSTVDHLAFEVALEDFAAEHARLTALGLDLATTTHAWVQWRSLYLTDPEGNQIELVCYDPSIS
jgi:catechol 2,3-dioxygenase